MKYLKRSILTLAIAVIPFHSYVNGCGGDYYDYMNYYNLFDQLLLENKGLQPFLLTTDYAFYGEDTNPDAEQQPDENLNAWMTFFKKNNTLQEMDTAQFKTLLYSASYQSLKQPSSPYVIALNKTDAGKQTLTYLQYAKELEPYAQLSENDGWWDMKRAASPSEETYAHYKNKGLELYQHCPYHELKLRYGYQLVRLAHYMRNKNNEAIRMYNLYVKPLKQEHYIYSAALEQTAGALYNIGKLANANYLYSRVFDHSDNRKKIAYSSFRIQSEVDWNEAMTWCKDNREKAAMYALRGYNTFSNELEEVENILEIYPESPYIKLLAIRYINKMERNVLTRYNHSNATDDTSSFMQPSGKVLAEYERGQKVIKAVMNHPKVSDKDFWALYLAHLSFLCKDYQQAAALIDSVRTTKPELLKQKSRTQFSLYLAQLKFIGTDEEKTIRQYLQTSNADEDFINEIVGHLYKMQKDYGKAFLTHNRIEDLRQNPDPNIINSLMSNAEKENDQALLTQLYELEGTYFLRMNNFEEAAKWFAKVPPSYSITHYDYDYETEKYIPVEILPNEFNGYSKISPLIFSNGFKRLFSVPADSQLTDTMYEQYPYLNQEHDKATLTAALMQLEKESQMMTEESARAAYMLANYYYNISPTGYYRNIPTYFRDNSYCWSAYGSYGSAVSNRIPDYSKEYNYRDFTQEYMTINNMENALALYEQAATYFTDREWKARALFMASSCTMDLYAQNWWDNWNNILDPDFKRSDEEKKVDSYFYQLAKSYSDTQFFKQAVHECKYFDYYVKNEF